MCALKFSTKFFIACAKYRLWKRIVKTSEQEQVLYESQPYTAFLQLSQWLFPSSIMPILSRTIFRKSAPFPYTFVGAANFRASPECHHDISSASVFIWWCSAGIIIIGSDSLLFFRFFGHSNPSPLPLLIASSIIIISCSELFVDNGLLWLPAKSLVNTQSCSHDDAFNCEGRTGTNFNLVVTKKK